MTSTALTRLFPDYQEKIPLEGLYLQHALHRRDLRQRPLVYSNFISSLDGRIAVTHPATGEHGVPSAITNRRDWRLYQELAAQADILVTSARYLRNLVKGTAQDSLPLSEDSEYADLRAWRREQGMAPQPAVVVMSSSLDLPFDTMCQTLQRPVYLATGVMADADKVAQITECGVRVIYAGKGRGVDGGELIEALATEGFYSIYSVAGPGVFETLVTAGVINRLYLTHFHRLLGGASYDTLLEGRYLEPPADFALKALYYDRGADKGCGQLFGVYDAAASGGVC